jgi:hypothetical protein
MRGLDRGTERSLAEAMMDHTPEGNNRDRRDLESVLKGHMGVSVDGWRRLGL